MNKDKKNVKVETRVKQKIATATKFALVVVVVSSVLVLGWLAKVISYEFYILTQQEYTEILASNVIGYVRDAETKEPVVGVEIAFNGLSTETNEAGYYKLELPGPGRYKVTVSGESAGYYNQQKSQLPIASLPYVHHIYLKR